MNPIAYTPGIDRAHPPVILFAFERACARAEVTMERWRPSETVTKQEQFILKRLEKTRTGAKLRERVGVEHRLAHLARRQGRRVRYRGVRKNLFDLRRACAIQNFETIQRKPNCTRFRGPRPQVDGDRGAEPLCLRAS